MLSPTLRQRGGSRPGRKPTILPPGIVAAVTTALLYKEEPGGRHGEFAATSTNDQSIRGLTEPPAPSNRHGDSAVAPQTPRPARPPRGKRGGYRGGFGGSLELDQEQQLGQEQERSTKILDLEQERSVELRTTKRRFQGNQKKAESLRSLSEAYGISVHQVQKLANMVSSIRPEHVLAAKTALPGILTLVAARHGLNALKYSDSDTKQSVNCTFGAKLAVEAMRGTSQGPVAPGVQILNYINTLPVSTVPPIAETPALEPGTEYAGEADPPVSPPPAPLLYSVTSPGEEPLNEFPPIPDTASPAPEAA